MLVPARSNNPALIATTYATYSDAVHGSLRNGAKGPSVTEGHEQMHLASIEHTDSTRDLQQQQNNQHVITKVVPQAQRIRAQERSIAALVELRANLTSKVASRNSTQKGTTLGSQHVRFQAKNNTGLKTQTPDKAVINACSTGIH